VNFLLGHVLQRCWPATSEYSWLLPQSLQVDVTLAPRLLLNLPTGHGFRVLVPSHQYPASHWVHAVCVFVVPPCVYDPVGHVLHSATPAVLNLLSEPHSAHDPDPACAAVPAAHADAPFSHVAPVGHTLQTCRVSFVHEYPDRQSVKLPATHPLQPEAPAALYKFCDPHAVHIPPVAALLYFPATHVFVLLVPSQLCPEGHGSQLSRFVGPPAPCVYLSTVHTVQALAPGGAHLLSWPQGVDVPSPAQA
jgi:hypothetical protein